MKRGLVLCLAVMGVLLLILTPGLAQDDDLISLTVDNAAQLRPLASIPLGWGISTRPQFSTDGRFLVLSNQAIDLLTLETIALASRGPAFVGDSHAVALTDGEGLRLYDLETGALRTYEPLAPGSSETLAALSPSGRYAVSLTVGGDLAGVWNLDTGERQGLLEHFGGSFKAAFSPDEQYVAWGIDNYQTGIFDVRQGVMIARLDAGTSRGLTFDAAGRLWTCDSSREYQWNPASHVLVSEGSRGNACGPDTPARSSLSISGGGTSSSEVRVRIDDTRRTVLYVTGPAYGNALLSPDQRLLVLFSARTPELTIYDVASGQMLVRLPEVARGISFTADGQLLITADTTRIKFWRLDEAASRLRLVTELPGSDFVLSPDEATLAATIGSTTVIYGIPSGERQPQAMLIPGSVVPNMINLRAAPNPDAALLGLAEGNILVGGRQGDYLYLPLLDGWVRADPAYVRLAADFPFDLLPEALVVPADQVTPTPGWATRTPVPTPLPTATPYASDFVIEATPVVPPTVQAREAIAPDNAAQVTLLDVVPFPGSLDSGPYWADETAILSIRRSTYSAGTWAIHRLDLDRLGTTPIHTFEERISNLTVSQDTARLAYKRENQIVIMETATSQEFVLPDVTVRVNDLSDLTFAPDGRSILIATYGSQARLYDVETGTMLHELPFTASRALAFDATGDRLAVLPAEGRVIYLLDGQSGALLQRVMSPRYLTYGAAFILSPGGGALLVTARAGTLLFGLPEGNALLEMDGRPDAAFFTPDGDYLLMKRGAQVLFYECASGRLAYTFDLPEANTAIALSPDGRLLATGNPLRLIDLSTGAMFQPETAYYAPALHFSADGSLLLGYDSLGMMVFGVPEEAESGWQPMEGHILPSSVSVRAQPNDDAAIVGAASGTVQLGGRGNGAVYLPELGGWVWSRPVYLNLDASSEGALPLLAWWIEE